MDNYDACKVCGATMQDFEVYSTHCSMVELDDFVRAYCPQCKKWYRWIEIFRLEEIAEFEEDV